MDFVEFLGTDGTWTGHPLVVCNLSSVVAVASDRGTPGLTPSSLTPGIAPLHVDRI